LWIHGHTHDPFDYEINGTRVICNPRGYPGENASWTSRAALVVEI
jgi:predicted phosphodiesterase